MEFVTQVEGECMFGSLVKVSESSDHVYSTPFSPDGKYLACVLGDGSLLILDPKTLHVRHRTQMGKSYDGLPSTGVCWFTQKEDDVYDLVSVSSAGGVFVWRWDGGQIERTAKAHEVDNEITCVEVSLDAGDFLTAGSDRIVRQYDSAGKLKDTLCKGFDDDGYLRATHTNRIFSVRFVTPTIAVSGGWGSPIQVWDMRSLESRKQILGTQIAADSIEPLPNTTCIIVTSKKPERQIQVFDCVSGEEMEEVSTRLSSEMGDNVPLVSRYCEKTGLLWTITSKSHKVLVTSFSTGKLLASCELPVSLMNIHISHHYPFQAIVSCANGKIFLATVKV
ncbi:putative WD domain, G-beta repeat [Trypanosoma cruzi]|uniref:Uncharacterized protein n=1 Tax=Trypanosoma cruzi TaxID=5693 RepID=A0A7J6XMW4_TRYCR|nr:hypothetical protein ECC02_012009 [Trypanosoma cruzi]KAF5218174.1 hypothetical protein ECC02_008886 [Trypanosoma cruzi]KAF8296225.1 putative WD domain, G-beta repeat [Trypanosoma cruzi]